MALSGNELFHFTKEMRWLESILINGFRPRYCLEDANYFSIKNLEPVAIPMVCFCDIAFDQLSEHMNMYGSYGISLKLNWGEKNRLSPIVYYVKESQLIKQISNLYDVVHNAKGSAVFYHQFDDAFGRVSSFIKPYMGNYKRGEIEYQDYKFYDEREWRYIPKFDPDDLRFFYTKDKFEIYGEILNEQILEEFALSFNAGDIEKIIVPTIEGKEEVRKIIEEVGIQGDCLNGAGLSCFIEDRVIIHDKTLLVY